MRIHRLWLLVIAAAIALLAPVSGQPPAESSMGRGDVPPVVRMTGTTPALTLRVRPLFLLQRGDIRVEVRVPRHADNRLLAVAWQSDANDSSATQRQLDGDAAPALHTIEYPSKPPANYYFTAAVFGSNGKMRGRADAHVRSGLDEGR